MIEQFAYLLTEIDCITFGKSCNRYPAVRPLKIC